MSYILFLDHQPGEVEPNLVALASMVIKALRSDIKAAGESVAHMFQELLSTQQDSSEVVDLLEDHAKELVLGVGIPPSLIISSMNLQPKVLLVVMPLDNYHYLQAQHLLCLANLLKQKVAKLNQEALSPSVVLFLWHQIVSLQGFHWVSLVLTTPWLPHLKLLLWDNLQHLKMGKRFFLKEWQGMTLQISLPPNTPTVAPLPVSLVTQDWQSH